LAHQPINIITFHKGLGLGVLQIKCNIFKCFKNQSDTYHDTRTHYLVEQDLLLLQDQAGGMDVVVVDRWVALKKIWAL
jgi:hypothetical protein